VLDGVDLADNRLELAQRFAFARAKDTVDDCWHLLSRSLRIVWLGAPSTPSWGSCSVSSSTACLQPAFLLHRHRRRLGRRCRVRAGADSPQWRPSVRHLTRSKGPNAYLAGPLTTMIGKFGGTLSPQLGCGATGKGCGKEQRAWQSRSGRPPREEPLVSRATV